MKIFLIGLLFVAINASGQLVFEVHSMGSSTNQLNTTVPCIAAWPYQKIGFSIPVCNIAGHFIIADVGSKNIIYEHKSGPGYFEIVTGKFPMRFELYTESGGHKNYLGLINTSDLFHINVHFEDKLVVQVASQLLSQTDSKTQFVRFLKLGPVPIDEVHFAVGTTEIRPYNIKTEPEININNEEDDLITDSLSYDKVKEFVLNGKLLQKDTTGLKMQTSTGSFKIIIDGSGTFFLNLNNSGTFFKGLYTLLDSERADARIAERMRREDFR